MDRTYETHKYAEMFPALAQDQFQELVHDVKLNGLIEPITMHAGKVLDGRSRLMACIEAGVEPKFVEFDGRMDPLMFVWAKNFARRHLDLKQRVMLALRFKDAVEAASKERMSKGGRISGAVRSDEGAPKPEPLGEDEKGRTVDKLAGMAKIGHETIRKALLVQRDAPDLLPALASGEMSIHAAAKQAKARKGPAEAGATPKVDWEKVSAYAEKLHGELSLADMSEMVDLEVIEKLIELADRIKVLTDSFYKGKG